MGKIDGKVAIVTGAARGQGAAEARLFADEGAHVVICDVLEEEGRRTAADIGSSATFFLHDVSRPDQWDALTAQTLSEHGRIDVLVNNAAIAPMAVIEEQTPDGYMTVVNINQFGTFLGMRAVIPGMKAARSGAIVNVASTASMVGIAGLCAYSASKFAVRGMTRCAAIELGPYGVRANCLIPGGIDTAMYWTGVPDLDDVSLSGRPLGRLGTPEEVARLALFLASDDSSFCTGGEFAVDGGALAGVQLPELAAPPD